MAEAIARLIAILDDWRDEHADSGAGPARGTIAGAFLVIEQVGNGAESFDDLLSKKKGQLKGCSKNAIQEILDRFGTHDRVYLKEGGRTNRKQLPAAKDLFRRLNESGLASLAPEDRHRITRKLQNHLYESEVLPWYQRQGVDLQVPVGTNPYRMGSILEGCVASHPSAGAMLQHIVAAFLSVTSNKPLPVLPASASDASTSRSGDFEVESTVFHVTVSPGQLLIEKCVQNVSDGLLPVVISLNNRKEAARQLLANARIENHSAVLCLCDWFGSQLQSAGGYSEASWRPLMRRVLAEYNLRVLHAERDRGLQFILPGWLVSDHG